MDVSIKNPANAGNVEASKKDYSSEIKNSTKINIAVFDLNKDGVISEYEFKNAKAAQLLAQKLDKASSGVGTDDDLFRDAMLHLTPENYKIVDEYLRKEGKTYEDKSLYQYVREETSGSEREKYMEMLRNVSTGKNPIASIKKVPNAHHSAGLVKDDEYHYDVNGNLVRTSITGFFGEEENTTYNYRGDVVFKSVTVNSFGGDNSNYYKYEYDYETGQKVRSVSYRYDKDNNCSKTESIYQNGVIKSERNINN